MIHFPRWEAMRLSDSQLKETTRVGKLRNKGKDPNQCIRADGHDIGYGGEIIYGMVTDQEPDSTRRLYGDSGNDFPDGVDVKTASHQFNPVLMVPQHSKKWPTWGYCLIQYHAVEDYYMIWGWATVAMLKDSNVYVPRKFRINGPTNFWLPKEAMLSYNEAINCGLMTLGIWGKQYD